MRKMMVKKLSQMLHKEPKFKEKSSTQDIEIKKQPLSTELDKNLSTFKTIYSFPDSIDVKIREFSIRSLDQKAFIVFLSTMADTKDIQEGITEKLLQNQDSNRKIQDIVGNPFGKTVTIIQDILQEVNSGNTALIVEGDTQCYIFETTNIQSRSIEKPADEVIVKGPKESFIEKAITNISLIRKKIKSENLVIEAMVISKRSRNDVFLLYEKDLVNDELLQKIKNKLASINTDAVPSISMLEQYIEERPKSIFPTILYTERPDRASSFIEAGHVVLLMENSPACLVLPATFWSLIHSPEDHYLRVPAGNFIRMLRFFAIFVAMFTSSIYIAITNFHVGMIPPDLLMAIAGTRERVPFPSIVEILMMELAFELIREAGLRVPSPIGPTIGIVGALIVGQAAVQANLISPIVIIVIALSGLSTFVVIDVSMNFAVRTIRILLVFAAGFIGIYGITAVFFAGLFYVVSIKSFGVPYLAPMTPHSFSGKDMIIRHVPMKERFRPGYLKPKDMVQRGKE